LRLSFPIEANCIIYHLESIQISMGRSVIGEVGRARVLSAFKLIAIVATLFVLQVFSTAPPHQYAQGSQN
jgi:hypothetical protein